MGDVQSSTPGAGTTQPDQRPPISISHEVDPNGDLTLLVPKSCESDSNTYFWVSSKHLTLASSYFNTMLKDCWTEGQALKDGTAEILVHDCKPQILLIVLNVIHGRQRQVPRRLLLNEMSAVAVTTDFFQCHEALEVMAGIWIEALKSTVPSSLGKDLKTWIMISSVFNRPHILKATTRIAMQWGTRPFDNDNLPIPKNIKDGIDEARQEYMDKLQSSVSARLSRLLNGPVVCTRECDERRLGYILKSMTDEKVTLAIGESTSPSKTNPMCVFFADISPFSATRMVKCWAKQMTCEEKKCSNIKQGLGVGTRAHVRSMGTKLQGVFSPKS